MGFITVTEEGGIQTRINLKYLALYSPVDHPYSNTTLSFSHELCHGIYEEQIGCLNVLETTEEIDKLLNHKTEALYCRGCGTTEKIPIGNIKGIGIVCSPCFTGLDDNDNDDDFEE